MSEPGTWTEAIGGFLEWSRTVRRHPATTLTTRRQHLQLLAKGIGCGPWDVTEAALAGWFASRKVAPNTYRARRTTMRAFYAWAVLAGHVDVSPAVAIAAGPVPRPVPRPVPDRVYAEAWDAASDRERLMVALAAEAGLRRGEVAVVHSRDLMEDLTGWSLLVHGKGGRTRVVPLTANLASALRALPEGYAFPGRMEGHLSPRWVGKLIARLLPGDWTMHKLRHRAGSKWWEASGHDLFVVQELLGHADPKTTRVYVNVAAAKLRATIEAA